MRFSRFSFSRCLLPLLAGLVLALSAACDAPPNRQRFADVTFQHLAPIRLNVAQVVVEEAYRSADRVDDIGAEFPQLPERAAASWANDRLRAEGEGGQATFTVIEAKATRTALPRSTGLGALLRKDQSDRYDLVIEVRLDAFNPLLGQSGSLSERVTRSQTVAEDLTLNQREVVLFNLLDSAMKDLNARLEQSIPLYLGSLLR